MRLILALLVFSSSVLASVQVFPLRVILTDKKRSTTVSLRNNTNKPQSYIIKPVFYRMSNDGKMDRVNDATKEERSLVKNIRFSPKRIKLDPKEEQVVRILAKKTGSLLPGDYRAHLRILPEGTVKGKGKKGKATLNIDARIAVSIPILYYKGAVDIKAEIKKLKLIEKPNNEFFFYLLLNNTGKNFLTGDFYVYLSQKDKKKKSLIGNIFGISSYVKQRSVEYKLLNLTVKPNKGDTLEVVYKSPKESGGQIITSAEITL